MFDDIGTGRALDLARAAGLALVTADRLERGGQGDAGAVVAGDVNRDRHERSAGAGEAGSWTDAMDAEYDGRRGRPELPAARGAAVGGR